MMNDGVGLLAVVWRVCVGVMMPLMLWGCDKNNDDVGGEGESVLSERPVVVFLGDSLTEGGRWSTMIPEVISLNEGLSGQRSDEMVPRCRAIAEKQPEQVWIMAGTNDLWQGRDIDHVVDACEAMVAVFERYSPETRVVLQSIHWVNEQAMVDQWGVAAIRNQQVAALHTAIEAVARQSESVRYVNVADALAAESGELRAELTTDGVHLTSRGYDLWGQAVRQAYQRLKQQ